jgi:hypothetical protein
MAFTVSESCVVSSPFIVRSVVAVVMVVALLVERCERHGVLHRRCRTRPRA